MLQARPIESIWATHTRYDLSGEFPGEWRYELTPEEYPAAEQWSLDKCGRLLSEVLDQLSNHPDGTYRRIIEHATRALASTTAKGRDLDPLSADEPLRVTSPPEAAPLLAAIQQLRYIKLSGMGGLDDSFGVDVAHVAQLRVCLAQTLATLTRL